MVYATNPTNAVMPNFPSDKVFLRGARIRCSVELPRATKFTRVTVTIQLDRAENPWSNS
jgi:hypothetical protein